jgi:DNA polymerase-3 subunit gamma/tau
MFVCSVYHMTLTKSFVILKDHRGGSKNAFPMENFIVSARKYRPATFDTVIGQGSITTTLKNAIRNNQLAQAFLFCGPRGVGKTTCARILAKTINCEHITDNIEPCNTCTPCLSFNTSASFNIHELDAASNNSVDDIRNLVDQVRIPPQIGKYKVYIIDEVHMLSQAAFNAFLKTLEEPPSYAKFILATTEKHKIIPTILSRCQIFDFRRISVEDIARQLAYVAEQEHVTAEPDALHIIAQKADGAMRDALSMFDQIVTFSGNLLTYQVIIDNLHVLDYDYYFRIVDDIQDNNTAGVLVTFDEIIGLGFDGQHFITGLGQHLRDLLVCKDRETAVLLEVGTTIRSRYQEQAARCSVDFLLKALDIGNRADLNYKGSNNKRLHLELALMQMCSLSRSREASEENKTTLPPPSRKKEIPAQQPQRKVAPPVVSSQKQPKEQNSDTNNGAARKTSQGSGVSIKERMENNHHYPHAPSDNNNAALVEKLSEPFSQEDLEAAWSHFSETLTKCNPILYTSLSRRKPVLKDESTIEFMFDNQVQEDEIRKTTLLAYLRKHLHNDHIQLVTLLNHDHSDLKPYTPAEKYKKMAGKNPDLQKLRDKLELDIDF